jgi:peptidoglycan hydrolase CwlO-like protein
MNEHDTIASQGVIKMPYVKAKTYEKLQNDLYNLVDMNVELESELKDIAKENAELKVVNDNLAKENDKLLLLVSDLEHRERLVVNKFRLLGEAEDLKDFIRIFKYVKNM